MALFQYSLTKLRKLENRLNAQWQSLKLASFRNLYFGRRAVIIGNGPSLGMSDLDRLHNVVTFASNKIYLSFEQVVWRPTVYTVCDALIADDNQEAILSADFSKSHIIHSNAVRKYLRMQLNARFYRQKGCIFNWIPGQQAVIRDRISEGLYGGGCSVVIDQIQLAYAMGCSEVILIGVDFSYGGKMTKTGEECLSGNIVQTDGYRNHFHPNYYRPGDRHTIPKIDEQIHAYKYCRAAFELAGRRLVNASRQTALTVLERANFDELF